MTETKITLDEKDIPRQWYNLAADLPNPPLPPLGPDGKPISPDMLVPAGRCRDGKFCCRFGSDGL